MEGREMRLDDDYEDHHRHHHAETCLEAVVTILEACTISGVGR